MPLEGPLLYYLDNFATVQEAADWFVRAACCLMHLSQPHHYARPRLGCWACCARVATNRIFSYADALVSEPDIATVARHVPKPVCVNMGFGIRTRATTPLIAPAQFRALGVAVVIYLRLLTACAVRGMKHGVTALHDAMQSPTVLERPELAVSFEELNALVGFAESQARERRYATEPAPEPQTPGG